MNNSNKEGFYNQQGNYNNQGDYNNQQPMNDYQGDYNNKTKELFNSSVSDTIGDLAPMNTRRNAFLLDKLIVFIPMILLYFLYLHHTITETLSIKTKKFSMTNFLSVIGEKTIGFLLFCIIIYILYYVVIAYFLRGQTIGKKICHLRIVSADIDNPELPFNVLMKREILWKFLSSILWIGYIRSYFSKTRIAVHDKQSETRVIYEPKVHF